MENNQFNGSLYPVMVESQEGTVQMGEQRNPFILGNSIPLELPELQERFCVPVFSKDNIETISHTEFCTTALDAIQTFFHGQTVKAPVIRCSHEMKLRTRNGAGKLVENLMPEDESSYMQRMMFMIEIPSIQRVVNGNLLNLQVVGVRSYAETNLLGLSTQQQRFRLGIGFVNTVCTNLLLRTDGVNLSIKVTNLTDLYRYCLEVFSRYDHQRHLEDMERLGQTTIDVPLFARFLGRARMASQMPAAMKRELGLPEFLLPESQINSMVRDYYTDENFAGSGQDITAWQFYQLMTNYRNNYIDVAMERTINAFEVAQGIARAVNHEDDTWSWFIS